jgi:aquaporin TIP
MPQLRRQALSEMIATFILIFIGAGSIAAAQMSGSTAGLTGIALAHGLAIFVGVSATAHISGGHINPAVTIAFFATKRIDSLTALVYIISQLLGAILGAGLLYLILPTSVIDAVNLGIPAVSSHINIWQAIAMEGLLTFILVFVIFQSAVHSKGPGVIAPIAIGLTVTLDILAGGPLTGAAMNPARWLGPALATGIWDNAIVYILGPISGGLLASLLCHHVLHKED